MEAGGVAVIRERDSRYFGRGGGLYKDKTLKFRGKIFC